MKNFRRFNQYGVVHLLPVLLLAIVGIGLVFAVKNIDDSKDVRSQAAGVGAPVQMVEVSTLPMPRNVRIFADDRVATLTWDAPTNASSSQIVGYIVVWGKTTDGTRTTTKQTIHQITQIQPLENGVEYTVAVHAVQGSTVNKSGNLEGSYKVANGNVSPPLLTKVTPSSARVDAMRQRLDGMFDDFNTFPQGAFDETKWNFATTACMAQGEAGQFINNQFHAHNMLQSTCDRSGNISRPRGIFDIAGRTEANPGQIEFDVDGASQARDVWYIDIIPVDARKTGIPIDVTSHNDSGDGDNEDPGRMLRINQSRDSIKFNYYDANNNPGSMRITKSSCGGVGNTGIVLSGCSMSQKVAGFSPLAQLTQSLYPVVPNVRRHWVIQYSHEKLKLFIDGTLIAEMVPPAFLANVDKYVIHSTAFSYNTGKQYEDVQPTTQVLHWDNFGFTAPVSGSNIVTHNYLDGGTTGTIPMVSRGTVANPVPEGRSQMKIPVPDAIGTPIGKARLMFTIQPYWYSGYTWNANHHILFNGKRYNFTDPRQNIQSQNISGISEAYIAHSTGMYIDITDIKQGMNDIGFNIDQDVINMHLEIDYDKNNEPSYTQPKDVFNTVNFHTFIMPPMRVNDHYLFVEQDLGLVLGTPNQTPAGSHNATPVPTSAATATPTPAATIIPTASPTPRPTNTPTPRPTNTPTPRPTITPTPVPTIVATNTPTPIVVATATPQPTTQPANTWTASYYRWSRGDAAKGLTGTPLVTRSLGSNLDLNWRWGSPASSVPRNNFSARFTKQETFDGGTYRFTIRNDDGVRVYVDGQLITSDATYWRDQAATTRTLQTSITPGAHTVTVEYYENRGRAQIAVSWIRL